MLFRTSQIALYCSKNIIKRSPLMIVKRFAVNLFAAVSTVMLSELIVFEISDFIDLFVYAIIIGIIALTVIYAVNFIFFKEDFKVMFNKIKNVIRR